VKKNLNNLSINLILLILINLISTLLYFRIDLTEDKKYSISSTSKNIINEIDDVMYIKIYLEGDFPSGFKRLQNSTIDLLNQLKKHNQLIKYELINPNIKNIEERNNLYKQLYEVGLNPTNLQTQNSGTKTEQIIFPGAIIYYKGKEICVNLLQSQFGTHHERVLNNSIENIEFEFINAFNNLINDYKPNIAFLTGNGQLNGSEILSIKYGLNNTSESLSKYYTINEFNIKDWTVDSGKTNFSIKDQQTKINRFDVLIIAKPTIPFNKLEKLLLDQYIMNGGKTLWLIDGVSMDMDSLKNNQAFSMALPKNLNIDDMLFKYGVRINHNLIMDIQCDKIPVITNFNVNQPSKSLFPWFYNPLIISKNNHPITKNIDAIKTSFISTIDTIRSSKVHKKIILKTSPYTKLVYSPHRVSLNILEEKGSIEKYNDGPLNTGVILSGKFKSFFENSVPLKNNKIKKESEETEMIFFSDGDIIKNDINSNNKPYEIGYNPFSKEIFQGNKQLIINSIHYLTGNKKLLDLRRNNFKIRLLDKKEISVNKIKWQILNIFFPLIMVLIFGLIFNLIRNKQFK
tara:strand:+ start:23 stop:1738 length:1716 start_codon:yes stop_codon:yes gene_type:complete